MRFDYWRSQDAPELIEKALQTEQDLSTKRNAFQFLCNHAQDRAVSYLLSQVGNLGPSQWTIAWFGRTNLMLHEAIFVVRPPLEVASTQQRICWFLAGGQRGAVGRHPADGRAGAHPQGPSCSASGGTTRPSSAQAAGCPRSQRRLSDDAGGVVCDVKM